ncbi:hypothetical protein MP228_010940 [Amoeboaphelidium protococcarum]|nr:hypothetical protein MP228_010940 [Amoeboaphelidium protococcarum]
MSKTGGEDYQSLLDGPREFIRDSIHLVNRCTKPDRREFIKVAQAVAVGFFIMGFIGFAIKLIHIPLNNIIMG